MNLDIYDILVILQGIVVPILLAVGGFLVKMERRLGKIEYYLKINGVSKPPKHPD